MIYDLSTNKAFCLNETSALVWQLCDGTRTVSEISEGLSKKLNSPANEDLVWLAIDQLKKENLIANKEELENKFEGMSRREVIKKVGLGTMIALPVVAGMIAPNAVNAASTCVNTPCVCNGLGGAGNQCNVGNAGSVPCAAGCACFRNTSTSTAGTCRAV